MYYHILSPICVHDGDMVYFVQMGSRTLATLLPKTVTQEECIVPYEFHANVRYRHNRMTDMRSFDSHLRMRSMLVSAIAIFA